MKRAKSLFIISLFIIFLLSTAKSMAQLQTSPNYLGDSFGDNSIYFFSPFFSNPRQNTAFFDNSFGFSNYGINPFHSLFHATSPISTISPWVGLNDPWEYRLKRYNSSTDPYYTLPPNFSNLSWMFGPYWNPLDGYINFIQNKTPNNQGHQGNNSASELINKPWKLQSFGTIGEEKPLIAETEITIKFYKDRYEGNAGCNGYFGTYEGSNNGNLSISPPDSTDMACSFPQGIMQQEYEYLDEILNNVCSYEINQDNLKLYYNNKQKVLNFMDESSPASKPKPAPVPTIMSGDWESDNPANGTGIMEYTQEADKHLIMITPSFALGKGIITEFSYIPTEGDAPIYFAVAFPSGHTGTFEGVANNSLCSLDVVCVWAGSFIVTGDYSILDIDGLEVDSGTFTLESPMTRPQITIIPAPVPTIMSGDWESDNPANGTGIMEYTQEADKHLIMITPSFALGKGIITEFSYIPTEGDAPIYFAVAFPSGHTGTFEGVANNSLCSLDVVCVWTGSFIVTGDYSILDSDGLEVDSGTFTLGSQ